MRGPAAIARGLTGLRPPRRVLFGCYALMLLPAVGFVGQLGTRLAAEVSALRREQAADEGSRVIGYEGIHPMPSLAARPDDWFRQAGDRTELWAGWRDGVGHLWFRVGRDELRREDLSHPLGRDVLRAIDDPIAEVGGGQRWGRIPDSCVVFGYEIGTNASAYPEVVLSKVQIINEPGGDAPITLVHTPFVPPDQAVRAYDARLDGRRITLGSAGYLHDGRPLLYDRGTESLWAAQPEGLVALAGPLRGARLASAGRVEATTWGDWRGEHPDGRLVVGADRDEPPPGR